MIQRTNVVEVKSKTKRTQELRKDYRSLSVFEQADNHWHYKSLAESEGINWYLLTCESWHFDYLLKNNLIEKF